MNTRYLHSLYFTLCTVLIGLLAIPGHASDLRQVAKVRAAPSEINNDPSTSRYHNEYPWFTKDGKLMLWTRQDNAGEGTQWLWVAYIKNYDFVANGPEGGGMRALDIGTPMELAPVNELWHGLPDDTTEIKAYATCEQDNANTVNGEWPEDHGTYWKYKFTLYVAIRDSGPANKMWRVPTVVVTVWKSTGAIRSVAQAGTHKEVIPPVNHPVAMPPVQANETEPMMSRDGQILFWASNAWGGKGNQAHMLGPMTACTQGTTPAKDSPQPYDMLPGNHYAWKDQYTAPANYMATSRTNYHTVITRETGRSALIFEECHAQDGCNLDDIANSRECQCQEDPNWFSTTGFDGGGKPTRIANLNDATPVYDPTLLASMKPSGVSPWRVTHPAVAGPQHPTKKTWLFFFMRSRQIYYTMLREGDPE